MSQRKPHSLTGTDARLVRLVFARPGIVRGEIAEALGVSPAGAADTIRQLVKEGALQTAGSAPSKGGRPATKLSVAPDFALAFAHSMSSCGLRSALIDAHGRTMAREKAPLPNANDLASATAAAEAKLATAANGYPVVGSAISMPGIPHPESRAVGKAPWLFGPRELNVPMVVLSHAEALIRAEIVREPKLARSLTLAVDMHDGATAVVTTKEGSRVLLNLMALQGPSWVFSESEFCEYVLPKATRRDSSIPLLTEKGLSLSQAIRDAEEGDDVVASQIVDELTNSVADFIATLVRMVRPEHIVLNAWLFAAGLCKPDEVKRLVRRRCPAGTAGRLAFRHAAGDEWTHTVGAGLCVIERWLTSLEAKSN